MVHEFHDVDRSIRLEDFLEFLCKCVGVVPGIRQQRANRTKLWNLAQLDEVIFFKANS